MSEFVVSSEDREYPPLYRDEYYLSELAEYDDPRLESMYDSYRDFSLDPDSFKPHVTRAQRIMAHVLFEQAYRDGLFNVLPDEPLNDLDTEFGIMY